MAQPAARAARPVATARRKLDLRHSRLAGLMGFHLRLAQVAVYRDFMAATAELGLTPKQYAVLELIAENPGVSQVDIAAALVMDRATMMALVDRLQARNLLARKASVVDRRRQDLSLTDEGKAMVAEARRLIAAHEARLLDGWTAQEVDQLNAFLRRLQKQPITA